MLSITALLLISYAVYQGVSASPPTTAMQRMVACTEIYRTAQRITPEIDTAVDTCYVGVIKNSLNYMSPHDFLVKILASDPSGVLVKQCHKIEHVVAMETYKRNHSVEDTIRECSVVGCGNGCTHGALAEHVTEVLGLKYDGDSVAHMGLEKVRLLGKTFCEQDASLCHGMGHILIMQGATLDESVALCKRIAPKQSLGDCYTGVFMEFSQGDTSFTYRTPQKGDSYYANKPFNCEIFTGLLQRMCFLHYPVYVRSLLQERGVPRRDQQPQVYGECAKIASREARASCFFGIGYSDGKKNECELAKNPRDEFYCSIGAGLYFKNLRTTRLAFCENLPSTAQRDICIAHFDELYVQPSKYQNIEAQ